MTLEEIITMAIPITAKDCYINKSAKERLRKVTTDRLIEWRKQENEKEGLKKLEPENNY